MAEVAARRGEPRAAERGALVGRARLRPRRLAGALLVYAALAVLLVLFLFPFYWMIATSVQTATGLFAGVQLVPSTFTLENYQSVVSSDFIGRIVNSVAIATGTTILTTVLALAGAYSSLRYRFRGKRWFSRLIVLVYLFPTVVVLVPMFFVVSQVGLLNNPLALVLIHTVLALPFCMWMLRAFLEGVPREPEEAALVFGAGRFTAFRKATLPLAAPGLLAAGAFAFIFSWGEFMFAFVLTPDPESRTVPVALKEMFSAYAIDWGLVTAAGVVATIPVLALFWLMSKYLAVGLARGAFE